MNDDAGRSEAVKRLSELLMAPEQLEKVEGLRVTLSEKKRRAEAELLTSMQEQLERARQGMEQLDKCSDNLETIHQSFQLVGSMCNASRDDLPQYPVIKRLTTARENLRECVENCKNLSETGKKISELQTLLQDDRKVYEVHRDLHSLEELQKAALQTGKLSEQSEKLIQQFKGLDQIYLSLEDLVMRIFEECLDMSSRRPATLVKAVMVIEREEKFDRKRKKKNAELQAKPAAAPTSKKSKEAVPQPAMEVIRGLRTKAFERLATKIVQNFDFAFADLEEDLQITTDNDESAGFTFTAEVEDVTVRYLKEANGFLKDMETVQKKLRFCMPKHYRIFDWFLKEYHNHFYTLVLRFANQAEILSAKDTINLVSWVKSTYEVFLSEVDASDIEPSLIEPLEELIRGFRLHIKRLMDEWIPRLLEIDRKTSPEEVVDRYYTDSPVTLFKILRQQMQVVITTKYPTLTYQVVLECLDAVQGYQYKVLEMYDNIWDELEFEYIMALINNNKKSISFVNSFEKLVEESLEDYYFAQVSFDPVRQGFIDLASSSVQVLAKGICRDFEEVMSLTGTREWRDTDDPYMDAVCDTVVDYIDNDVSHWMDPEYSKELLQCCVLRIVDLYIHALLQPSRNKCAADEAFFSRLKLERRILFDFCMVYISSEKFATEALSLFECVERLYRGPAQEVLTSIQQLFRHDERLAHPKHVEFYLSRRNDLDKSQVKSIIASCKELIVDN